MSVSFIAEVGDPKSILVKISKTSTMLVMGSHGKDFTARELGSVSHYISKFSQCPVMVVKEPRILKRLSEIHHVEMGKV